MIREIYRNGGLDDVFQSLERKKIFGLGGSSGDSLLIQLMKKTLTEIKVSDLEGLTKISDSVFSGLILSNVILPDTITSISNYAFKGTTFNGDVVLPDSITSVGDSVFRECIFSGTITLPSNLTNISNYMFFKSTLTNIPLSNNITSIGQSAFGSCKGLDSFDITIPDSVTSIGAWAFSGIDIGKLTLNNGVTSIGEHMVSNSSIGETYYNGDLASWFNINFLGSSANPMYHSAKFYLKNASGEYELLEGELVIPDYITEIPPGVFEGCKWITGITIHDRVTSIGDYAFGSIELASITIPDSVTSIGYCAFDSRKITNIVVGRGMTKIDGYGLRCGYSREGSRATYTFLGTTPPTISSYTLDKTYINKIIVPKGCGDAYKTATNWANFADYIEEAAE